MIQQKKVMTIEKANKTIAVLLLEVIERRIISDKAKELSGEVYAIIHSTITEDEKSDRLLDLHDRVELEIKEQAMDKIDNGAIHGGSFINTTKHINITKG